MAFADARCDQLQLRYQRVWEGHAVEGAQRIATGDGASGPPSVQRMRSPHSAQGWEDGWDQWVQEKDMRPGLEEKMREALIEAVANRKSGFSEGAVAQ